MERLQQRSCQVMADQINTGILERIPDQSCGNQVYNIPHHVGLKVKAETKQLKFVYDCSSKESNDVLNVMTVWKLDHRSYLTFLKALFSKG